MNNDDIIQYYDYLMQLAISKGSSQADAEDLVGDTMLAAFTYMHSNKTIEYPMFSDAESRRDEWNRLKPLFDEIMTSDDECIIVVSHGDLLSVWNTMFLGMDVETLNQFELFGMAGGVSFMLQNDEGKRFVKKMSDLSYMA